MNRKAKAYLFGQAVGNHSFLLKGGFLQPDEYAEIEAKYFLPGGETGTAATVLDALGAHDGLRLWRRAVSALREIVNGGMKK